MEEEEKIGLGMARIHVTLDKLLRNLPNLEVLSTDEARKARLEVRARLHDLEQLIIRAEEDIAPYELAQRNFNTKSWWYQFWNGHLMGVPVRTWQRQLADHKALIAEIKPRFLLDV